ncbi:hypothetical protein RI129_008388 [Pyrocoelia pectoralis]|uniref:THAP-type domain-containing protein n=1 Tax=Pyrocoelia pectoralis TaxID=417401 RepID=A0AAN7VB06_9COLE
MEPSKRCYKWCFVPMCTNTTFTTPEKTFLTMPRDVKIRKMWFKAARRDYSKITSSDFYCCEDHFDDSPPICPVKDHFRDLLRKLLLLNPVKFVNALVESNTFKSSNSRSTMEENGSGYFSIYLLISPACCTFHLARTHSPHPAREINLRMLDEEAAVILAISGEESPNMDRLSSTSTGHSQSMCCAVSSSV